jgi:hypothetical protein
VTGAPAVSSPSSLPFRFALLTLGVLAVVLSLWQQVGTTSCEPGATGPGCEAPAPTATTAP